MYIISYVKDNRKPVLNIQELKTISKPFKKYLCKDI